MRNSDVIDARFCLHKADYGIRVGFRHRIVFRLVAVRGEAGLPLVVFQFVVFDLHGIGKPKGMSGFFGDRRKVRNIVNGVRSRIQDQFARGEPHIVLFGGSHFIARHTIGVIGSLYDIHGGDRPVRPGEHFHIGRQLFVP